MSEYKVEPKQQQQQPAKKGAFFAKHGFYNRAGIKAKGGLYFSEKDGYTKGFATSDECVEHFNKDD